MLEEDLVNQFIDRVRGDGVRIKLLRERPATLEKALKITRANESICRKFNLRKEERQYQNGRVQPGIDLEFKRASQLWLA